jgi:hypothetical protein
MPKLGTVTPGPDPVDPFKGPAPSIGVVSSNEVSVAPPAAPKIGVVPPRNSKVVSVAPVQQVPIGVVQPAYAPPPPPPPAAPAVGLVTDQTPVYPAPPPSEKPNLGTVVDLSITPPRSQAEEVELPESPVSTPNVVDPFAPKE